MRHRFAPLVVLAVLILAVPACTGDPPSGQRSGGPSTTAAGPELTTPPPTRTIKAAPETTRPAPDGVIPAGRRQPAPALQVTAFDGTTVTLGGFRGQPVVVNFFESW